MNGKDVIDFEELSKDAIGVIKRAFKEYSSLVEFLMEQDKKKPGYTTADAFAQEEREDAIRKCELLHKILGYEGKLKWKTGELK